MAQKTKVVIAIHGRGEQPPKNTLQQDWREAIEKGLSQRAVLPNDMPVMVYYADIYYAAPHYEPFMNMTVGDEVRHIAGRVFRDWNDYDTDPSVKTKFQQRLKNVLNQYNSDAYDIFLIAHSMGTVISYDVLSQGGYNIRTWVTIGSALKVDAPRTPRLKPIAVGNWYNLYSENDWVVGDSLPEGATNFPVKTAGHDAVYYLSTSKFGELLAEFLTAAPVPSAAMRVSNVAANRPTVAARTIAPLSYALYASPGYQPPPLYYYVCPRCNFQHYYLYVPIGRACPSCGCEMNQMG